MAKNDGTWLIWLAAALLGGAAVADLMTPRYPCPHCGARVKEWVPSCWNCHGKLYWQRTNKLATHDP